MAVWQVDFEIIPDRMLRAIPGPLAPRAVATTRWWEGVPLPPDARARLDGMAPRGHSRTPGLETWGTEDGNRVDVWSEGGVVTNVGARVDVRRLDAKFGAALLELVRHLGATLVRRDGVIVAPTIGAFGAALRGAAAWRHANDPAAWAAGQIEDQDT